MPKPSPKDIHDLVITFDRRGFEEFTLALREGFNFEPASKDKFSGLYIVVNSGIETTILLMNVTELLLEAGGNPLRPHLGDKTWVSLSPLLVALNKRRLALVFLMLWYLPKSCEEIKVERKECGLDQSFASEFELKLSVETERKKPFPSLACFTELSTQAYRYQVLLQTARVLEAKVDKTKADFMTAAACYAEAAAIFKNRIEHESEVVYPIYRETAFSATPAEFHAFFKDFYERKYWSCIRQQYQHLAAADAVLTEANLYPEPSAIDEHLALLNQLIDLAAHLSEEAERRFYLRRIAEVMMRKPAKAVSAAPARAGAGSGGVPMLDAAEVHLGFEEAKTTVEDESELVGLMSAAAPVAAGADKGATGWSSALSTFFSGGSIRHRPVSAASATDSVGPKFG